MKHPHRSRGTLCASAAAIVLLVAAPAHARKSSSWATVQFATANRLQQSLEARPVTERTRRDYQRAIAAYQRVYNEAPTAGKADPSVAAAAQLLEEMGRQFKDDDVLRSAISQYQLLRREYPGSRARFDALFRIGEIYHDDLHDKAQADAAFQEFLHRYPRHPLAAEARKSLAEPVQQAAVKTFGPPQAKKSAKPAKTEQDDSGDGAEQSDSTAAGPAKGSISRVLGVRHWSTPDYTRIAIDLDQPVKYQAQRIENPDRLFFDLYGAKLDRKLSSKSLDVDDGFLKKIRIAQFATARARVVLDLDELTDYHASLQSNPWRLIIDIQNKRLGNTPPAQDASSKLGSTPAPPVGNKPTVAAKTPCDPQHSNADAGPAADCESNPAAAAEAAKPEPPVVQAEAPKPAKQVVVGSDGVKKTIVYADDDSRTVAKLEAPDLSLAVRPTATAVQPVPSPPPEPEPKKASKKKSKQKSPPDALDIHEAEPTASGDRSLIRALGLKIGKIVIDPGHGGHDTGTIGPHGLEEKDLVLDVSLRLGKLLASRLGAEVVFTRKDDTFIPLEDRTAIANHEAADLFVSVHANSSRDPDARGTETYYLNFTSSPDALEVAARENAVSEKSIHELQDLVKKIALKEKIEESQEFANDVESSLHSGLAARNSGLRDRGVKKAPFIVLIGANMPSILAEISFVSNPADERRLKTPDYRQKIAESLYRGIARYVNGLSGVKVASKIDKGEGQ